MEQNTEQNTTNTEEISNSQDTKNTDIEPETEEVVNNEESKVTNMFKHEK